MESLEITARSVNEAIEKALARLGKSREEVDISVLSEGSRGILGIGGEEARILVSVREPVASPPPASTDSVASAGSTNATAEIARGVLENLLAGMRVSAEVAIKPPPAEAFDEGFGVALDVEGAEDVGILIGRRGETLSAIQFMTTLIVAKKVGKWTKVLVDVEGYRSRREVSLRSLAQRVAGRVQETRQPMALEAMPPNERRVIHVALQNHPAVTTASTGEGDQRRVVISPKR
ncbi:MAG TPA: RNA-binding cell elongation regulator Jag/EloR [Chloroflexota bacterium]|nr:RNA-binding cell elongation regulator Jag/EloR [Chloroflexota bacterium]